MLFDEMTMATLKTAGEGLARDAELSGDRNEIVHAQLLRTCTEMLNLIGKLHDRTLTLEREVKALQRTR
jgi:hypothetical protein